MSPTPLKSWYAEYMKTRMVTMKLYLHKLLDQSYWIQELNHLVTVENPQNTLCITFGNAYNSSGYSLKLESSLPSVFLGDGAASARAEANEKRRARNRRKRVDIYMEGLGLHLVEATEKEKGEGVASGGCAGE